MKRSLAIFIFLTILLVFPLNALAASSSSIRLSDGVEAVGKDFSGKVLIEEEFTNADLEAADFSNSDLRGAVFNGSNLAKANLRGANFSFGIAYIADFQGADLRDAIFEDAMMLRSNFEGVDITGADFTNAVLDKAQEIRLCQIAAGTNPQTGVSTRESLGCR